MAWLLATAEALIRIEPEGAPSAAVPARALCVAAHPTNPAHAYAGLETGDLLRTTDGGRTWAPLPTRLPHPIFSLAVSAHDGAVYAGTEPSALFKWTAQTAREPVRCAALEQLSSRPTWSFPPRPWTHHVRWIAPAPDSPTVLCGIELGGVLRSPDGGATWEDQRPGAEPDCHCLHWPAGARRVREAAGGGTAFSLDGGATWQRDPDGLDRRYTWALCADPGDPDTALLSASPSPMHAHHRDGQAEAALFRKRGAGPWQRLRGGLPERFDHLPMALCGTAGFPGHVTAWLRDGTAWATVDGGEEWARLRGPLPGGARLHAATHVA